MTEFGFVDHVNLRQLKPDRGRLAREVAAAKANIDHGQAHGATSYVLFSRGFEDLLRYDFAAGPVENLGAAAFIDPPARAAEADIYLAALREVADHARAAGMALIFHTNQVSFPAEVYDVLEPHLATADAPCVDGPLLWDLYRAKLDEFWRLAPFVDGLQLTADEADISVTECAGRDGRPVDADAIMRRLVEITAAAGTSAGTSVARGKSGGVPEARELQVRAWGRLGELTHGDAFEAVLRDLPPRVMVSIKQSEGDFLPGAAPSHLLEHMGPRVIVEFDAWGEYAGWNFYPAYLGDVYGDRMRRIAARGGRRIAVRLNWNEAVNGIFDAPYGNAVNVAVLAGLARDPGADPDDLLRDWIARTYPLSARDAAFDLYKGSRDIVVRLFSPDGIDLTDHGRLLRGRQSRDLRERVLGLLVYAQSTGALTRRADFEARRRAIEAAGLAAERAVEALGPGVASSWREEMLYGARTLARVAELSTDQLEMAFWYQERLAGRPVDGAWVRALAQKMRDAVLVWEPQGTETFERLNGPSLVPTIAAFGFDTL